MRKRGWIALVACLLAALPLAAETEDDDTDNRTKCTLDYYLKGWSAFYKTSKGEGTITCDNGESADVKIKVKGGGITFGKREVTDGEGSFTPVRSLEDLLGNYGHGSAHAGASKSVEAAIVSKGDISLTLTGKGNGFDVGIDFGKWVIARK